MLDQFVVTFAGKTYVYTGTELINFVKTAVVNNKDIANFEVTRVTKNA